MVLVRHTSVNKEGLPKTRLLSRYSKESAGSFQITVTYTGASYAQVRGLANYADKCDYFFRYDCTGSIMTGYGWWRSYSGTLMKDWRKDTSGICAGKIKLISCKTKVNNHFLTKPEVSGLMRD